MNGQSAFLPFHPYLQEVLTRFYRHMALHGRILSLKQDAAHLHYRATWPENKAKEALMSSAVDKEGSGDDTEDLIRHYFSLKHNAANFYDQWSASDANFRKKAPRFTGIRIMSQDAWEALIGFICSSNNNISRISQMVRCSGVED
jgi:N-glycosylase/DNA lyase